MPKSAPSSWARAWWHTRGAADGLGQECIYKRCLQSKFLSILTSGLFPGALVSTPPAPPAPLPSGVLSLCHFVILAQTAIYGGQHFLPLFPLPLGPWLPLKSILGPFQTCLCRGLARQAGGGPSWAHLLFTRPPTPRLPHPSPHARLASPGQHNGATAKFSLSAVSFQGPWPPPSGSPYVPRVGVRISEMNLSIVGLFQGNHVAIFSLINLTFPQSTSFPHLLPTRDIPETVERKEGSEKDRQTR